MKLWRNGQALGKLVAEAPARRIVAPAPRPRWVIASRRQTPLESWRRRAQAEHPADFWLSFSLAAALCKNKPVGGCRLLPGCTGIATRKHRRLQQPRQRPDAQEKLPEAIAAFRKAIELDPETRHRPQQPRHRPATNRASWTRPSPAYRKAIEIDPKDAMPTTILGNCPVRIRGSWTRPSPAYRKAIELDPKFADRPQQPRQRPGDQEKLDEAIAWYRKAIELDPKHAHAHNNLGNALYRSRGSWTRPSPATARPSNSTRNSPRPTTTSASPWRTRGSWTRPSPATARPSNSTRNTPQAHNNLGNALKAQGKMDEAIACYRKAIELDPKYAAAHNNLGIALKAGEGGRGHRRLPQGHRTRPEIGRSPQQPRHRPVWTRGSWTRPSPLPQGHRTRPEIRQRPQQPRHRPEGQGKLDEAIACYRKAIELDPKYASAHNNLGTRPARPRGSWTRPSPATARPSNSTRNTPPPTATSATPCMTRGSWTRPSPPTARPSNSTRNTPTPTTTSAHVLNGPGEAGRGHRLLPQGHRTRPETRQRPQQPRQCPGWLQGSWTRPSPAIAGPSNSTRNRPGLRITSTALGNALGKNGPGNWPTAQTRSSGIPNGPSRQASEAVEVAPQSVHRPGSTGMGPVPGGKLEGQPRGPGEVLQTAEPGRLRPVDRDVLGPWETGKRKGPA